MADILKDTEKAIKGSRAWVATEYGYLKDLRADIGKIRDDPANYKKYMREARKAFAYFGRAEYRAERKEANVDKDLKELAKEVPPDMKKGIENVAAQFDIARKQLIKGSSRYTGDIRDALNEVGIQAALIVRGGGNEAIFKKAIAKALDMVDEINKWIRATETTLANAETILVKLEAWVRT